MITLPAFQDKEPVFSRDMLLKLWFCFYWSEVFSRVITVANLGKWLQNQKEANLGLSTVERLIRHGLAQ